MCFAINIMTALPLAFTGAEPWIAWLIGAGLFAFVVLLVIAAFAQQGQIKVSDQRAAALATGHSDRRTVFEKPLLQPVMWLMLGLSHRLAIPKAKAWLRRTLISAGSPEYYTAEEYLALSMLTGVSLAIMLEVLNLFVNNSLSIVALIAGVVIGTGLSLYQIYSKAAERMREVTRRVPYALDLIALAMGAGATFTEAVQTVVNEKSKDPFNVELRTVLAEMDLGTTRRKALENLAERVPVEMLQSIVASVIQAEELGTPLAEVLHSEATLMRLQRSVRAENAAAVASVRILVPSLLILMSVILTVFGPAIIRATTGGLF